MHDRSITGIQAPGHIPFGDAVVRNLDNGSVAFGEKYAPLVPEAEHRAGRHAQYVCALPKNDANIHVASIFETIGRSHWIADHIEHLLAHAKSGYFRDSAKLDQTHECWNLCSATLVSNMGGHSPSDTHCIAHEKVRRDF